MTHGTEAGYRKHRCRCELCRAHHALKARERYHRKREAGVPVTARMPRQLHQPRAPRPRYAVPSDRIWPHIQNWISQHSEFKRPGEGGLALLARRMNIDPRAISSIQDREWISFNKADRILIGMDRIDLWRTDLADIYEQEAA